MLPPDWQGADALRLPVAALDFETTGLDPSQDWPVSVAVVSAPSLARLDLAETRLYLRIRSPVPIPAEATTIHGLTDADVAAGRSPDLAARDVLAALRGFVLVGHWLPFDVAFLRRCLPRGWSYTVDHPIDTLCLARRLAPEAPSNLAAVAERLDVDLPRAHHARDDARAALGCAARLIRQLRHQEVPAWSVRDLWQIAEAEGPAIDAVRGGAMWTPFARLEVPC